MKWRPIRQRNRETPIITFKYHEIIAQPHHTLEIQTLMRVASIPCLQRIR